MKVVAVAVAVIVALLLGVYVALKSPEPLVRTLVVVAILAGGVFLAIGLVTEFG